MIEATLGQLPPELAFLPSADQDLFDRIDGLLCDGFATIRFKNGAGAEDANLAREIGMMIRAGNPEAAAKYAGQATKLHSLGLHGGEQRIEVDSARRPG